MGLKGTTEEFVFGLILSVSDIPMGEIVALGVGVGVGVGVWECSVCVWGTFFVGGGPSSSEIVNTIK